MFAYSFDVESGTSYPFSRVFWSDVDDTDWPFIFINIGGSSKNVNVRIKMGDKVVVDEKGCASHSEWRP